MRSYTSWKKALRGQNSAGPSYLSRPRLWCLRARCQRRYQIDYIGRSGSGISGQHCTHSSPETAVVDGHLASGTRGVAVFRYAIARLIANWPAANPAATPNGPLGEHALAARQADVVAMLGDWGDSVLKLKLLDLTRNRRGRAAEEARGGSRDASCARREWAVSIDQLDGRVP